MTPTLSVEAFHVIMIELVDRAVPTRPVGVEGGVVSPVAVGDGDGLDVGDGEAEGDGDGDAVGEGEALGDGLGDAAGVTRPVIVHCSSHWSGAAPCTIEQF